MTFASPLRWLLDEIDGVPRRFDSKKYPLVIMNRISDVHIWNSDPKVTNDLFNKHKKLTDKVPDFENFFKQFLGKSLFGIRNDDDWRAKRKAVAHGFYKDRIKHMIECLKE